MQAVLHRHPQVLQASREKGGRHQRGTGEIVHGILPCDFGGEGRPGSFGFQLEIRDENSEADAFRHRYADGVDPSAVHNGGDQAAEQRGSHVVGMALQLGREVGHVLRAERAAEQGVRPEKARDQTGR